MSNEKNIFTVAITGSYKGNNTVHLRRVKRSGDGWYAKKNLAGALVDGAITVDGEIEAGADERPYEAAARWAELNHGDTVQKSGSGTLCVDCGYETVAGAKFCSNCGANVAGQLVDPSETDQEQDFETLVGHADKLAAGLYHVMDRIDDGAIDTVEQAKHESTTKAAKLDVLAADIGVCSSLEVALDDGRVSTLEGQRKRLAKVANVLTGDDRSEPTADDSSDADDSDIPASVDSDALRVLIDAGMEPAAALAALRK